MTHEEAFRLFDYDPLSGLLTRRTHTPKSNARVGDVVGSLNRDGHLKTIVRKKHYLVHRIIWLIQTGYWPAEQIDHVNGIPSDNRWVNLREASHVENARNRKKSKHNTSGVRGVTWHKQNGKWQVQIRNNGTTYYLGCFDTREEASACYEGAAAICFGQWLRVVVTKTEYFKA